MELSHFSAALVFALCSSVVFGITQKNTMREMMQYVMKCFLMFAGRVILASWLMWLLKH
jgi:uncharacterized PurR-regulated membrane protein YhhQ (DUF165 family)